MSNTLNFFDLAVQLGLDIDGEAAGDRFGTSVSMSADGSIVAIGAILNDGNGGNSGHVRVFQYDATKTSNVTDQNSSDFGPVGWRRLGLDIDGETANDWSGISVSLSTDGSIVAIGSYYNDGNGNDSGHVRVFQYASSTWTKLGQDIDGAVAGDFFGISVSLSDNGTIVASGALFNDGNGSNSGHVRVYQYASSNWTQLGEDIDGDAAGDQFGQSVSLSYYDSRIRVAIGATAPGTRGYARVFEYDENKMETITDKRSPDYGPSKWRRLYNDVYGLNTNDYFGVVVSISADGNRFAVSANISNTAYGYVQVYDISYYTSPRSSVRIHEQLYNDISGTLSTYFTDRSQVSFNVVPELILTNTLHPSSLTISQINNIYIRYRQSQLGFLNITVNGSGSGGTLPTTDISNTILASGGGFVHLDISASSIPADAFKDNLNIYSVSIGASLTDISNNAFSGCTNLAYLSFHPDSTCNTIGQNAFYNNALYDLALPDSLTTIGQNCFQSSTQLTAVCIPNKVTSMGNNAFGGCTKLVSIAVPSSTYNSNTYFTTSGTTLPSTRLVYNSSSPYNSIPHFKLSDYSIPTGIIQNVIPSGVTYIDHRAYAYYPEISIYAINIPQTSGRFSYVANGVEMPIMPAAYLLNGASVTSNATFPVFRSVPDLNVYSFDVANTDKIDDTDDFYILMPGYSICIYNNLYDEENLFTVVSTSTYRYFDNEFGQVPLNIDIGADNTTSSILILYNGCIVNKKFYN